jgi:hypothetical protein
LIIQWKIITTTETSETTCTFPISFSNQNYAVLANRNNIETGSMPIVQVQKTGNQTCKVNVKHCAENVYYARTVSVFAIGY